MSEHPGTTGHNGGAEPVSYWHYSRLDNLLELQHPVTDAHDEMQFIIVHQTFELKLAIYELRSAIERLKKGDIAGGAQLLHRVAVILRTAYKGFDPLMTMSQQGYAEFRSSLSPASGFQSVQFRVIEMLIGIERIADQGGENSTGKRRCRPGPRSNTSWRSTISNCWRTPKRWGATTCAR